MAFTNVTLAMDLALTSPGFAVLATEESGRGNAPIILESSHITTKADQPMGQRLHWISNEIIRLVRLYRPTNVVRERGFSGHARTTQAIFRVVGVSDLTIYEMIGNNIIEITPSAVKKAVTGGGKASKQEVADAVFEILQIDNTREFYTGTGKLIDDKTDAAAVGLAYLMSEGIIQEVDAK